jgi:hypothetical protein
MREPKREMVKREQWRTTGSKKERQKQKKRPRNTNREREKGSLMVKQETAMENKG